MLACEWLRRRPQEVAGVVLVNTSLAGASPPWRRLRPAAAFSLLRAALDHGVAARERRLFALTSTRVDLEGKTVHRWVDTAIRRPIRPSNLVRQLIAASRYTAPARDARSKTLVLVSRKDRLVHPSCSLAVARTLGADVREHPSAGHDLPLDDPTWVIGAVREWLQLSQFDS